MVLREAFIAAALSILGAINYGIFLFGYSILRWARISVNWATWIIGGLLILLSAANCFFVFMPDQFNTFRVGGLLGFFSLFIGMYALAQWGVRTGYIWGKKRAIRFPVQAMRNLLLFLRKHHQFFGWLVLITAAAHALAYLPEYTRIASKWWITGLIGLALLGFLTGLGLWIERQVKLKRLSTKARLIHIITAITFFVVIYLHLAL
jgi:hypothetical protein